MAGIKRQILEHSEKLPAGAVLAPKAFLHLGSRAAVDQALSRLARDGQFLRVGHGRYVKPIRTRFGVSVPSPVKLVEQIAQLTGETIVPSGASAANALGLTTQIPVRPVFLTSGRSRRLTLGQQVVELRHAPPWQLWGAERQCGQALRALAWLGPEEAPEAARRVIHLLPEPEREELLTVSGAVPPWLSKVLTEAFLAEAGAGSRPAHD